MKNAILYPLLFITFFSYAQVGIGTTTPDVSAALDLTSTTQGFLPPRLTTVQRDNIASSATGLVIYNTTTNALEYKTASGWVSYKDMPDGTAVGAMNYWNGTNWVSISPGASGEVLKFVNNTPTWSAIGTTYYLDADGDGYGVSSSFVIALSNPIGYVSNNLDCNDSDDTIYSPTTWYIDNDLDGYGGSSIVSCVRPNKGFLLTELSGNGTNDCNDSNSSINPNTIWYIDVDGDDYGSSSTTASCVRPTNGFLLSELSGTGTDDCNDNNAAIRPNATEIGGNTIDENCDGNLYVVGDYVYGGVVFYVAPTPRDLNSDGVPDYGLICSIEDLTDSTGVIFSTNTNVYNFTDYRLGFGKSNTDWITFNMICPPRTLTSAYSGGGYTDWFLPTEQELTYMFNNKAIITTTALLNGGSDFLAPSNGYWSSYVVSNGTSRIKWTDGNNGVKPRNTNYHGVRAIRVF